MFPVYINVQILNEMLTKRILKFIKSVIYHEQVQFIPGMQR